MSSVPPASPDFIPDDEMPDFISDADMAGSAAPAQRSATSRFLEPIGEAAKALASLPGAAASAMAESPMGVKAGWELARGIADQSAEQAVKSYDAFSEGDIGEGVGRALATVPVVGPAGAQMGEAAAEGNIAGALGQAAVNFAPGARVPKMLRPTSVAGFLRNRAAARILDTMRPSSGRVATAEDIALEVAEGTPGREALGGIGVGTRKKLAGEAKRRAAATGKEVEALQTTDTPIDTAPVSTKLRDEASRLETVPPTGIGYSEYPALVKALRSQADEMDDLAASFGGDVPSGELFKQRGALGRRFGKVNEKLPGDEPAAAALAGNAKRAHLSKLLHTEVSGSEVVDRANRVWKNAAINLERSRLRDLMGRKWEGMRDLLAGRLAGVALGAGVGGLGMGPMGGVAGALAGAALGESAFWQTLRASTYVKIARHLNSGQVDEAVNIIQRSAAAYAADKGIRERERHRKAEQALRTQAEGVVSP